MRISDWSSDVCSSDLIAAYAVFSIRRIAGLHNAGFPTSKAGLCNAINWRSGGIHRDRACPDITRPHRARSRCRDRHIALTPSRAAVIDFAALRDGGLAADAHGTQPHRHPAGTRALETV